jgi:hypothetical protein
MAALVKIGQTGRENAAPENSYWGEEYGPYTVSTTTVIPHGLAKMPKQVWLELKCLVAEIGYAVGDRVSFVAPASASVSFNNVNITVALTVTIPTLINPSTNAAAAITIGSWNLLVKAEIV